MEKPVRKPNVGGYSIPDLSKFFGVDHGRVESWAERGLLGKAHRHGGSLRFTETGVARFIRQSLREYDLATVDRRWFKRVVFGVRLQKMRGNEHGN